MLPDTPVYFISSVPILIKLVPELGNWEASVNTIVVVEASIAPFNVVVMALDASPPQELRPQPKPFSWTADPTV